MVLFWIVEVFDVVEYICFGVVFGFVDFVGCFFCFEWWEEVFYCGVVLNIVWLVYWIGDVVVGYEVLELFVGILVVLVWMM